MKVAPSAARISRASSANRARFAVLRRRRSTALRWCCSAQEAPDQSRIVRVSTLNSYFCPLTMSRRICHAPSLPSSSELPLLAAALSLPSSSELSLGGCKKCQKKPLGASLPPLSPPPPLGHLSATWQQPRFGRPCLSSQPVRQVARSVGSVISLREVVVARPQQVLHWSVRNGPQSRWDAAGRMRSDG